MARVKFTLSVDIPTKMRLKEYAWEHRTSVSQAISDWIWDQKVIYEFQPVEDDEERVMPPSVTQDEDSERLEKLVRQLIKAVEEKEKDQAKEWLLVELIATLKEM